MKDVTTPITPIAFGVGCFSFEAPKADHILMQNPSGTYTIQNWAVDVEKYLQTLPSIDHIRVEGFMTVRGDHPTTWRDATESALKEIEHDGHHHGGALRPHPVRGRVSFTVTIPVRTQLELNPYIQGRVGTRFDVDIRYDVGMPVAFVRTHDDFDDPSSAVAIVREFLRSEEKSRPAKENPIRFVAMGPSPLWSDFYLSTPAHLSGKEVQSDPAEDFESKIVEGAGYSRVIFVANNSEATRDPEKAYTLLQTRIQEAASIYYDFISQGLVRNATRRYIEAELEDLVDLHRTRTPGAWIKRLLTGGYKANNLLLEILAVDLDQRRALKANSEAWMMLEGSPGTHALDEHVQREINQEPDDYALNAREIVDALSARQAKHLEVVAVVLASILGGAVGATLTAVAGYLTGAGS